MKNWSYVTPGADRVTPVVYTLSEAEILLQYFTHWSHMMRKAGKEDLISDQRCIEDFCTVNWCTEVER